MTSGPRLQPSHALTGKPLAGPDVDLVHEGNELGDDSVAQPAQAGDGPQMRVPDAAPYARAPMFFSPAGAILASWGRPLLVR